MSASDPVEMTAPAHPADYARPRGLGVAFWAVIAFGVLCVVGGAGVASLGPQLFPPRTPPVHAAAPAGPAVSAAAVDARLADIQARLSAPPAVTTGATGASSPQLNALADRVDRVEAGQQRLMNAASGALAAASLTQAASASRPFAGELAALEAALPDSVDVRALRPFAETGAPTPSALAAQFPDVAARAAVAARAQVQGTGFFAQLAQALAAIVTVRRVDNLQGDGVDAILARAGRHADDGDLTGAVSELDSLPPAGHDAFGGWRLQAQRRIEIDRRVAAIRAAALAELARSGAQRPAQPAAQVPPPAAKTGPAA